MFLSIYKRYYSVCFEEHGTKEEALSYLTRGSDEGYLFEVAVYDLDLKGVVWSNNCYLTQDQITECLNKVLADYKKT